MAATDVEDVHLSFTAKHDAVKFVVEIAHGSSVSGKFQLVFIVLDKIIVSWNIFEKSLCRRECRVQQRQQHYYCFENLHL
jgi:hypothetical protein